MIECTAFYLSSNLSSVVMFDFITDIQPIDGREGFMLIAEAFRAHVNSFGKTIDFPAEITQELTEEGIDRLLHDCEISPELTFFLHLEGNEQLFSIVDGNEYRMCGDNGKSMAFKTINGHHIDVVNTEDAHRVFCTPKIGSC